MENKVLAVARAYLGAIEQLVRVAYAARKPDLQQRPGGDGQSIRVCFRRPYLLSIFELVASVAG